MSDPRPRRFDPFAAALIVFALALACFAALVGIRNPPAGFIILAAAGLMAANGYGVQRAVRE